MSERVLALKDHDGLCWNCLKEHQYITVIKISELGYGSMFDGFSTEVHLCTKCYNKTKELWNLEVHHYADYCEEYCNEDSIFEFFNQMPIQSQQFIFNEFDTGFDSCLMEPQDWIDYKLGVLPYDKCKEYGLYAPEEIQAYKERFPICEYPAVRVFSDKSQGSWCPFGASGDAPQKVGLNISNECYKCKYFKKRETSLKTILNKDWADYVLYIKSKENIDDFQSRFK